MPEKAKTPNGWTVYEVKEPKVKARALTIEIGQYRIAVEIGTDEERRATCLPIELRTLTIAYWVLSRYGIRPHTDGGQEVP